jgi:hypothetical protein
MASRTPSMLPLVLLFCCMKSFVNGTSSVE